MAQIPSPVAESALKYIFRALKITILPLTIPPDVSSGWGNPLPYLPLPPHVGDFRSNLLLPT